MPAFTPEELAQIKENTKRIEADRARQASERQAKKKSGRGAVGARKTASAGVGSVRERLVALALLLLTMAISYLIMILA